MEHVSGLSILIPTYNHDCTTLVRGLHQQASLCAGLRYEILVSDDGSTDRRVVSSLQALTALPHYRYLRRDINAGRAVTRNLLARSAQYDHLLYIDSHMSIVADDYLSRYLAHLAEPVVYGGYSVQAGLSEWRDRLRYRYEVARHHVISIEERQAHPYQDFHTSNFMIHRELVLRYPFDERFRRYGYEDVFFGRRLAEAGVRIQHIDNPVGFHEFESNDAFLCKTEEGLRTLWEMRHELRGYSRLLSKSDKLRRYHLGGCIRLWHRLLGGLEHRQLQGRHPQLWVFNLWRMGEFFRLS